VVLALLAAHHVFHISRIKVKGLIVNFARAVRVAVNVSK
jgi:hypothetical protein